nr:unnamed protein product [Callosobruchus analis]
MNDHILELLDGDYTTYFSNDSVETEDDGERLNFTIEFLNSINPSGMPQYRLRLKVGTVVMLLRILNTKKGLCNGTKLVISSMQSNLIVAKRPFASGVVLVSSPGLPNKTGSNYWCYLNQFSLVLLATVGLDYKFISVDIGGFGKNEPSPAVIIGDEAFALKPYLLRAFPYKQSNRHS